MSGTELSSHDMNISEMLTEQVQRLFTDHIERDTWVSAEDGKLDAALWQAIESMGITLALGAEDSGGAGLSWAESEPVLRLCGAHAAPVPVAETTIAAWALSRAGLEVPEGVLAVAAQVFQLDAQGKLHGHDDQVSWLPVAAHVLVAALQDGVPHLCLVRSEASHQQAMRSW